MQERALKVVPNLCETIDYAEVQGVIFPRVAVGVSSVNPSLFANKFASACVHQDTDLVSEGHDVRNFLSNGEDP